MESSLIPSPPRGFPEPRPPPVRAGFSLRRLTRRSFTGGGLWNHLLRCRFPFLGKGVAFRTEQNFGLSLIPVSFER